MKKGQKAKILAIVLACVFLDIALHIVTAAFSTMPENPDFSIIAGVLGTEITALLWALIAFSGVAFVFFRIRSEIPGEGVKKGLRYGASVSILWLVAMLEGVSLFGNPFMNEFIVGLSDAIPVFVLSILLSTLPIEKAASDRQESLMPKEIIQAISIFTGIFLAGRYLAYSSGFIRSGIQIRPLETFVWTFLMGMSIGTAFALLGAMKNGRPLRQAAEFGFLIFGLNWALFLVFMPLLFSGYIVDALLRIIFDTITATIASYIAIVSRARLKGKA